MKTLRLLAVTGLVALVAFALAGCTDDSVTAEGDVGVDDYSSMDFTQEYGGLTETDEPVAFEDEYLAGILFEEDGDEADDPLATDLAVVADEAAAACDTIPPAERPVIYALRAIWGMLDGPIDSLGVTDESYERLDWSGAVSIDRGVVIIRRLIRFERPGDHRDPRPDRRTVVWTSHTGPHFDGLLLEIIVPPSAADTLDASPNMLHFRTGPWSGSWNVEDLADLEETHDVETPGNSISLTGYLADGPAGCPHGFVDGLWLPMADGFGVLKGRLVKPHGGFYGLMRGAYGYDAEGNRVFVAKIIGRHGGCRGLIRGTWEPDEAEPGSGKFLGRWRSRGNHLGGVIGGQYRARPEASGGCFGGRWTLNCNPETEEVID